MSLAPIILFVYNRPVHTRKVLEALSKNQLANLSDLTIFSDGAKENATEEEIARVAEVRKICREKEWSKNVSVIESEKNKGLANSITEGVTRSVNESGRVIVLEDDLVTSEYFLSFMNDALTSYENNSTVACISGYVYPVKGKLPETFFLKGAECWGWATWKRAWDLFEKDGKKLLQQIENRKLENEFDFNGSYAYKQMLEAQIRGENDSWAIRWYASSFLNNRYCLYPGKSFVNNIGIDGSGIHSGISTGWNSELAKQKIVTFDSVVKENNEAKKKIIDYFNSLKPSPGNSPAPKKSIPRIINKIITKLAGTKKKG